MGAASRHHRRGRALLVAGDVEAAIEPLRASVDLCPDLPAARIDLAAALCGARDPRRAADILRAGLARSATPRARAVLWLALGDALTQTGDHAGASDAFAQAATDPELAPRAADGLARSHARAGDYPAAFAQLLNASSRS